MRNPWPDGLLGSVAGLLLGFDGLFDRLVGLFARLDGLFARLNGLFARLDGLFDLLGEPLAIWYGGTQNFRYLTNRLRAAGVSFCQPAGHR